MANTRQSATFWYGMPANATVGFSDAAALDDGAMWATSFAVTQWTEATESRLRGVVKRSVGTG